MLIGGMSLIIGLLGVGLIKVCWEGTKQEKERSLNLMDST